MIMMYGTLFMMPAPTRSRRTATCAGTLIYGFFSRGRRPSSISPVHRVLHPRDRSADLRRYFYAADSWRINEHSNITYEGPPVYPFKTVIPLAGAFVLAQGIVEIIRCIICIRQGEWPAREEDVQEVDVDKLKHELHVKDEDIAKLDKFVVQQERHQ